MLGVWELLQLYINHCPGVSSQEKRQPNKKQMFLGEVASSGAMGGSAVYLLAVFAFSLSALSHGQPLCTLITPSVLRVESEEMVIVEAHGHHSPIEARITVYDFPQKKSALVSTTVSLNPGNGMMNSAKIKVPAQLLPKDTQKKEYVYIEAKSSEDVWVPEGTTGT